MGSNGYSLADFKSLRNKINEGELIELPIVGQSMRPLIKENDRILVERISSLDELKRFDIVVFYNRDRKVFVCHYLWGMGNYHINNEDDFIQTKPLNPILGEDYPIEKEFLMGKVKNFKISFITKVKIFFLLLLKGNDVTSY